MPLPAEFKFEPMTELNARAAASWRYEPPYDFYNHEPSKLDGVIDSFLDPAYHYYAVLDEQGALIAYYCFGKDAQVPGGDYRADALDIGGGLRPDLTGYGLGPKIMSAAMEFARSLFAPRAFRVTIAEFNLRARRAWEKIGFISVQEFVAPHSRIPFVVMLRDA
jgi:[ribosomal protein S18]-alanine N-acetyltransferase